MSYQVLARKWRPKNFMQMVGQQHVLKSLQHALDAGRLHHAYLFTGTRGVGKTTLSRVLAKSLNCLKGVSSTPCGVCSACIAIDQGRFVDLIEVDAASRTKVEDTREILDNVQYAPTEGRYKVYLIDEVHMLSTHSFNALLKTLEEPPRHVKFLLATTDPQKLPATVLSRCLRFHLRPMAQGDIEQYLAFLLVEEKVSFEKTALAVLAQGAKGSMRDALSLLDQAISYGQGVVKHEDVVTMLGAVDRDLVLKLLEGIAEQNALKVIELTEQFAHSVADYSASLEELIAILHRLALAQVAPSALAQHEQHLNALAQMMNAEQVQLYYQIALTGYQDLIVAPDQRVAFEMLILRMLAFTQIDEAATSRSKPTPAASLSPSGSALSSPISSSASAAGAQQGARQAAMAVARQELSRTGGGGAPRLLSSAQASYQNDKTNSHIERAERSFVGEQPHGEQKNVQQAKSPEVSFDAGSQHDSQGQQASAQLNWHELMRQLRLVGVVKQLAAHCCLHSFDGNTLILYLDPQHAGLKTARTEQSLLQALHQRLGQVQLLIELKRSSQETPAAQGVRIAKAEHAGAVDAFVQDAKVQALQTEFGARVDESSIQWIKP
ncbi:DNA polymerase III subunit gamma/tau [Piscirickettsia salmonis]|uniref:DNA polymerase III subunit gamma/tau n=2 Tax=Piscirickettsia salmonis TaxID=1238 RepID=A0A9Q6PZW4_PISSA|nr:DNA polymerase III subunit gamma/tau [Piscirickettsia salmonis]ALA25420.1 DNA polymerase III subunit gamma/tau [Piscirickettsia salmonis]APS42943.1 DNA polymerase III subunit gamma/tau [Piscirickettsia salmonis]APS46291.1 DNA polymerase III subunit gamma/tau [Piscirickettsia salmonis]APS50241.1 DNA polymerase III subunit gamma/tau [Piscirickettsia salmonis]APS53440.1 DNA polymerase III subunit gamma/tau [Piscirickettsia salmonis]